MNKLTITLSVLAAATLSACGANPFHMDRSDRAERSDRADRAYRSAAVEPAYAAPAESTTPLRNGNGRVAYLVDPNGPINGISTQRITLHMDDGSMQTIDRRGKQVALGEHVRLRTDNTLRRDPLSFKAAD
jgi:hypothetical protein